jgi:superfamily II DNA or RNA helicase
MTESEGPRRDPRRLFTDAQRTRIASRQRWQCHECENDLPDIFHVHHVIPWAIGGLTEDDNGVAVCPLCHFGAEVKELPGFDPMPWQREATKEVLPLLRRRQFATICAATGAGKTWEACWIYRLLADAGIVVRMVVFVPNTHLRTQWESEAKALNVFLQTKGTTEGKSYDGVVLGYQALSDPKQVEQIIKDAKDQPTFFVNDECHHLAKRRGGGAGAWAISIARILGTVDNPLHSALNLTGTLFRSKNSEQITTIRYCKTDDGKVETIADYTVLANRLINEGRLRHIKVLGFDADMRVEAVDIARESDQVIRAVDIDDNSKLRTPLLASMVRDDRYLKGFINEMISRLGHASTALRGYPVKGLITADGIEHCEQIYSNAVAEAGPRQIYIAHGDMSSAEAEIERFRVSKEQAILIAVQKVVEGFNVPDICVLGYLRTWRAQVFINQQCGRAMRITDREKELKLILPATVIIPNESEIKLAFANVLAGPMNLLDLPPDPCGKCGREICACPPWPKSKICSRCEMPWRYCTCPCRDCGRSRATGCECKPIRDWQGQPDINLEVIGDGEVVHVSIDGLEIDLHWIAALRDQLRAFGLQEVQVEQAAGAMQSAMASDPMTFLTILRGMKGEAA